MKVIMNDSAFYAKGFSISTDKKLLDIDVIYNYLNEESYWAKGITRQRLEKAIEHSVCFGVYDGDDRQAGFARVVTDKATFAYLCDVFVLETYRGQGLSKWLVQTIVSDADFQGLRRWALATLDAHGLYKQFGFSPLTNAENWMGILTPYITQ
jgi:N-acetylglutamate synthase-like GNAT family acetyltransferase